MKTTVNEEIPQETGPILQLNRPLLSIAEYAAREGLTKGIIEECGKLGIVPIRRHKGKAFVVDIPIHSYSDKYEIATIPRPIDIDKAPCPPGISQRPQMHIPEPPETEDRLAQFAAEIDSNGTIFKSIQKDFPERLEISDEQTAAIDSEIELTEEIAQLHAEAVETTDQPMAAADQSCRPQTLPEIIQTPELQTSELQASEIIDDLPDFIDDTFQIPDALESTPTAPSDSVQVGNLKSKYLWQSAAVFSLVCLSVAIFTNLWFYTDRRIQLNRLDQAYASIQQVYDDYTQNSKHAENIQNELDNSRARVKSIQNELDKSTTEVQRVRNELALARQNFENSRQYDTEAVEQLHKQIQELATRLTNLTKNP